MATLLLIANGTPILATKLFGSHGATPIDFGLRLADGESLFGVSKTWRGIAVSLIATAACGAALGMGWRLGLTMAAASMGGDLCSSFLKRRLRLPVHSQAPGVDQIPEALLPLIAARFEIPLTWGEIAVLILVFTVAEILLSRLLFRLHIRDRPY